MSIDIGQRGVLWDMDGVLVDTGEFHFQAWSQTLTEYDIPFSRDLFRATFGMNNTGLLAHLLGQTPQPEFTNRSLQTEMQQVCPTTTTCRKEA